MGGNLTPRLKRVLQEGGCRCERQGKGDHEIWYSPLSERRFVVDAKILSRHTANAVLGQAGLPKSFCPPNAPAPLVTPLRGVTHPLALRATATGG